MRYAAAHLLCLSPRIFAHAHQQRCDIAARVTSSMRRDARRTCAHHLCGTRIFAWRAS